MEIRVSEPNRLGYEAFGPYCVYHLARGLSLNIGANEAYLRGGPELFQSFEAPEGEQDGFPADPSRYATLVSEAEGFVGSNVVAKGTKHLLDRGVQFESTPPAGEHTHVIAPQAIVFRYNEFVVDGPSLSSYVVYIGDVVRNYSSLLIQTAYRPAEYMAALNIVAGLRESVEYGHIGPESIDEFAAKLHVDLQGLFFLENLRDAIDSTVQALERAYLHFLQMTGSLWRINQGNHLENFNKAAGDREPLVEIKHYSAGVDRIALEFTSGVIACYSCLDMLYALWVLVVRNPFGSPTFPEHLHFPDSKPSEVISKWKVAVPPQLRSASLARAIPNLPNDHFKPLRKVRNDLVHNMGADEVRALAYIGVALPPVNGKDLQYAQYLTRDVLGNGDPVVHPWVRRFYQQQRDGQLELYHWIGEVTQCVIDTLEWLTIKLKLEVDATHSSTSTAGN